MSFNDIKQEPNIIIESFYLIVVFKSIVINLKFFAEPYTRPWRLKILALCPEHPKRDQNPKFTPLSETTSIPVCFIWESPPRGGFKKGKTSQ